MEPANFFLLPTFCQYNHCFPLTKTKQSELYLNEIKANSGLQSLALILFTPARFCRSVVSRRHGL